MQIQRQACLTTILVMSAMATTSITHASTYTVEIPWEQTASLGSTGCCNYGSLGALNGSFTYTGNCQTVYGSCVQSKRTAFWTFDLSSLPSDATIVSASFKGLTEYSDQGGSASTAIKAITGSLTTSTAMSVINSPNWQTSQYLWCGAFSVSLSASTIEAARDQGKIALRHYVSTTNMVSIYNSGSNAAHLSLVIETLAGVGGCCSSNDVCFQAHQTNCENAGFTFLGEGVECDSNICEDCTADYDDSGTINVDDLLALLSVYGTNDQAHDLNGDNWISVEDVLLMIAAFGDC